MPRGFEDTGAYPQWPQVADAVLEAFKGLANSHQAFNFAPATRYTVWGTVIILTSTDGVTHYSPFHSEGEALVMPIVDRDLIFTRY